MLKESWGSALGPLISSFYLYSHDDLIQSCLWLWILPICAQPLSRVWLFVTPRTVAHQASLSMGIQARILEWVASPSSRGSSQLRDWTLSWSPTLQVDSLLSKPPGKPRNTGVGSLSLLQGNVLIQESGRSSGKGNGNPLQYSCLENPMDRGAW